MIAHLLFDFFGTLVDYERGDSEDGFRNAFAAVEGVRPGLRYKDARAVWATAWETKEAAATATMQEYAGTEVGREFLELVTGNQPSDRDVAAFMSTYMVGWTNGIEAFAGVGKLLEGLSTKYDLGIISNTHTSGLVENQLERMGVASYFRTVVTSVDHGHRKPHPRIFADALKHLSATVETCVYVGDSYESDYVGARVAGLRTLLIDLERKSPIPETDCIDSVFDLEGALDRMT